MTVMRTVLLVVGLLGVLIGVVWMGQGSGYFPYPGQQLHDRSKPWIWRGLAVAVIGLALALFSRRLGRAG